MFASDLDLGFTTWQNVLRISELSRVNLGWQDAQDT